VSDPGGDEPPGSGSAGSGAPGGTSDGRRGSFLVAAGILLSRLAGLVREIAISGFLGVSAAADAFKAALRIPNLLQNLLGEGVLSASFIPVYAKLLDEDDREAGRLAGAIAGLLCGLVAVLVVLGMLLARPLTLVLTPGFSGERLDLAVDLLRIMFPGIGFLVLSAWCLGILNSHRRFFLSYVAPVLWNAAQIVAVVAAGVTGASGAGIATALAWGVVVGGALQLGVQLPAVRTLAGRIRLTFDTRSAAVRNVLRRFGPVVLGRGVIQILTYIDLVLASLLAVGSVAALTYAQVLYLLPISLFGMAVAAAELPELARIGRAGHAAIRSRIVTGTARVTFYVAPTVALYIAAGDRLVGVLLQRGEFAADDTTAIWLVLAAFALGLLATTRSRLLQNGLYALDRTKLVARVAVLRVVLSAGLGALLMFPLDRFAVVDGGIERDGGWWGPLPDPLRLATDGPPRLGVVGLALGAAVSSWVEYRVLRGALEWRIGRFPARNRDTRAALLAALAAGAVALVLRPVSEDLPLLLSAAATLGPAGIVYLALTMAFGVTEARSLAGRLRGARSRDAG
jgi:putative peptidoglycan lipid II flippase